ncbi:dehydrogenase/reductase SDR family member 9-like isoform X1 [Acropora muricata]|uniref:dehydrogenase/reductase SDR family member 9-like isoform X1 n=1 Tax=Acropora muricata TaxID=159855 RepID=UPI0034E389E8
MFGSILNICYDAILCCPKTAALAILLTFIFFRISSKKQVKDLANKYVLITGCDSGFGHETAVRLDKLGIHVLATCLTKEGEQGLKSATSDRLRTFQLDLTDSQQVKNVYEQVKSTLPSGIGLWGLVNNAGITVIAPVEWLPLEKYKRIADVNLWGLIEVTKTFLPLIKKAQGRVVNFSSMLGRLALPRVSGYSITKYGVQAFSDALRREMSPWGIQVSIIEPGLFKTAMANEERNLQAVQELWDGLSPQVKEEYGDKAVEKIKRGIKRLNQTQSSPDTFKVVDAVVDALTSQKSQTRYAIGQDAKMAIFISFLPTFIADYLVRKM